MASVITQTADIADKVDKIRKGGAAVKGIGCAVVK